MATESIKNWEALKHDLEHFDKLEDFQQEAFADYINCPNVDVCKYDGVNGSICTECKARWLNSEWEE